MVWPAVKGPGRRKNGRLMTGKYELEGYEWTYGSGYES